MYQLMGITNTQNGKEPKTEPIGMRARFTFVCLIESATFSILSLEIT